MQINDKVVVEWQPIIGKFYQEETHEFLYRYQKAQGGLIAGITDMVSTISPTAEFHLVDVDGEDAAFFVRTPHDGVIILEGFHIRKKFRNAEFIPLFWKRVRRVLGDVFFIGIWEHNLPAIKHLKKNGFEMVKETEDNGRKFLIFLNKIF